VGVVVVGEAERSRRLGGVDEEVAGASILLLLLVVVPARRERLLAPHCRLCKDFWAADIVVRSCET
jgi:hypothetical protein